MAPTPSPETAPESTAALRFAVGPLQSDVARVVEGQADLRTDVTEANRRIDRLFYAQIGVGAGVIGTLVAVLLRGN